MRNEAVKVDAVLCDVVMRALLEWKIGIEEIQNGVVKDAEVRQKTYLGTAKMTYLLVTPKCVFRCIKLTYLCVFT